MGPIVPRAQFFSTFFESFLDRENHGQDVKCGPKIHPERLKKFLFAFLSLSLSQIRFVLDDARMLTISYILFF